MIKRATGGRNGFTIMEMIAVLLVIAVLVVFIATGDWVDTAVASDADVLRSHVRYAEALAMANNTAAWSIRLAGNRYSMWRNNELSPIPFPGESSAEHVLSSGVTLAGGDQVIPLNQWGAPDNNHVLVLADKNQSRSVIIHGFTGFVP